MDWFKTSFLTALGYDARFIEMCSIIEKVGNIKSIKMIGGIDRTGRHYYLGELLAYLDEKYQPATGAIWHKKNGTVTITYENYSISPKLLHHVVAPMLKHFGEKFDVEISVTKELPEGSFDAKALDMPITKENMWNTVFTLDWRQHYPGYVTVMIDPVEAKEEGE